MKKIVILLLVMLFFLDFYGTFKYIGILLGLSIFILYPIEFLKIKSIEIFVILFGITYVLFASFNMQISIPTIYAFTILPIIIFKVGKHSIRLFRTEKNIVLFLSTTLGALSFLFVYSVLLSYLNEGIIGSRTAQIRFHSRTEEISGLTATLVGLHIVPLMSFMPLYFFQRTGELTKYFLVGSLLTVLALIVTSLTATRTPVIILGILLIINFYYGFNRVNNINKAVYLGLSIIVLITVSAFDFSNFELTSFIYERMVSDDLSEAGSRTDMWLLGLENIFKYPLGGEKLNISYFHNLWLDVRYDAGVVPMMFLMVLSLYFTYTCWRVINSLFFSVQIKAFLGSVYLSLFLMMFMEPVIQGSFVFFMYYIFFGGVLTALKDIKINSVIF